MLLYVEGVLNDSLVSHSSEIEAGMRQEEEEDVLEQGRTGSSARIAVS